MMRYIHSHKWITVFSILGGLRALSWLRPSTAQIRGVLAAQVDIPRGRYEILGRGLPSPWRSKCPLPPRAIQGRSSSSCRLHCVGSPLSYVDAYDSAVEEAARASSGMTYLRRVPTKQQHNGRTKERPTGFCFTTQRDRSNQPRERVI